MTIFQPYPEYKDSGLHWLGKVPKHWDLCRAKYLMREVDTRSKDGGGTLLSVSQYTGVTKRRFREGSEDFDTRSSSLVGYKIAKAGDLVSNIMLAWNGSLGIAPLEGVVSPAYCVYRIYNGEPWFFHHLLRSPIFKAEIKRRSRGVVDSRLRLYTNDLFRIPMLLPNLEEQQSIVCFVRNFDRKINAFIHNRQRLIEVLNEQKQRLTQRAITSSSTKLHRMRDLVANPKREVERVENQEYRPIGLYNWGRGIFHKPPTSGQYLGNSVFFWVEEGDLVFSGQFAWEGAVSLARRKDHRCIASHRYPIFISKTASVRTSYLESFFQSSAGQLLLEVNSRGAAGRNRPLNIRSLLREMIPVPSIDEQLQIEEFSNHFHRISDFYGRQIDLIREYRARLIADVVTGKVDVRGVMKSESVDYKAPEEEKELLMVAELGREYESRK
ncbi:MAG: hypothetical protein ACOC6C_04720 [Verrucomicrobiota bacterium]